MMIAIQSDKECVGCKLFLEVKYDIETSNGKNIEARFHINKTELSERFDVKAPIAIKTICKKRAALRFSQDETDLPIKKEYLFKNLAVSC